MSQVPRVIHQMWMGDPAPEWIVRCIQTVQHQHEGWSYYLWNEQTFRDAFEMPPALQPLWERAADYALPGRIHQFRADLARYVILLEAGGVWVDTDIEMVRPLSDVPVDGDPWLVHEVQDVFISNAVMAIEPGNEFVEELIGRLPKNVASLRHRHGLVSASRLSGPRYLTQRFSELDPNISVLPQHTFFPYGWNELSAEIKPHPGRIGVHHFANQRRIQGKPLEMTR